MNFLELKHKLGRKRYLVEHNRKTRSREKMEINQNDLRSKINLGDDWSYQNQIDKLLGETASYILKHKETNFDINFKEHQQVKEVLPLKIPSNFCLIENPDESYSYIKKFIEAMLSDKYKKIQIDYHNCENISVEAQVFLDIIYYELKSFGGKRKNLLKENPRLKNIEGINIDSEEVKKILFTIGSPAYLEGKELNDENIITYKLLSYKRINDKLQSDQNKAIHSTELVDYVIKSLGLMGKKLTSEKRESLSIVIGEVLINAEEHSTIGIRHSTGYFKRMNTNEGQYGIFNLVIMNFGESIYSTFKKLPDDNKFKTQMSDLSNIYHSSNSFSKKYDEEVLWSLCSIQEGVTSVMKDGKSKKRGSGSIKFIESFFNIKKSQLLDDTSRMSLISGSARILFNGAYSIIETSEEKGNVKKITFNESNSLKQLPDLKYVHKDKNYFPGTIISAKILINKDDIINI
jgi:hypothetical protein